MLVVNEGPVRAGKSYDAVVTHILPALKSGRKVYARLNGLDFPKIAAHLQLPLQRIEELLVPVAKDQVVALFTAFGDDPPRFVVDPDALIVIDEAQDFYVADRKPLPSEQEQFFAKHGHIGLDVVLITQSIKRLHATLRERIERKNVFTKLNALGKEDKFVVRFYSVGEEMGKLVKISSETRDYDPAIFPLYKGFQPEAKNTGAYKAGSKSVLSVIGKPAIIMGLVLIAAVVGIASFFTGGTKAVVKEGAEAYPSTGGAHPPAAVPYQPGQPIETGTVPVIQAPPPPPVDELKGYPVGVRHLIELGRSARPRFSGTIGSRYLLEWRTVQGNAIERMTSDQLQAMGWLVVHEAFGVVATYRDRTVLFTAWPIDPVFTQSTALTQRIQQAAGPAPLVSASAVGAPGAGTVGAAVVGLAGGVIEGGQVNGYGGLGYGGAPSSGVRDGPGDTQASKQ